jgi:hypothetical protein
MKRDASLLKRVAMRLNRLSLTKKRSITLRLRHWYWSNVRCVFRVAFGGMIALVPLLLINASSASAWVRFIGQNCRGLSLLYQSLGLWDVVDLRAGGRKSRRYS